MWLWSKITACKLAFTFYSDKILMVKHANYEQNIEALKEYYSKQHQNWVEVGAKISKWKLWKIVRKVAESSIQRVQSYLDRIARGSCLTNTAPC